MKPVCIIGPTASGKSHVAMEVAARLPNVELVSIDSMQVYVGMDIGTAKPSAVEQAAVPHHLIDIADPTHGFAVGEFQKAWTKVRADLDRRNKVPLLVGGTGLYLRAVVDELEIPDQYRDLRLQLEQEVADGTPIEAMHARLSNLDPAAAARMEPNNERRVLRALEVTIGSGRPFSSYGPGLETYLDTAFHLVALDLAPDHLDERISTRYGQQMELGFLEECEALLDRPGGVGRTARQALGYRELFRHLETGEAIEEALTDAITRTRRFARRQRKWHRRDPRIEWHRPDAGGDLDYTNVVDRVVELASRPY